MNAIPQLPKIGHVGKTIPKKLSKMKRDAVMVRWESVQVQHAQWLEPFYKLPIERAMVYLEDLRKICVEAGTIMNDRIGNDPNKMRCSGPRCGKDLSGLQFNGRPKWLAKKDIRDKDHPEIIRSFFFCSEICHNLWVRKQNGAMGGDGK